MTVSIDWKEYYREFSNLHGGDPVLYRRSPDNPRSGYLLFRDGWRYSSYDPKGPEYPPPEKEKEHIRLIQHYWAKRASVLRTEYHKLKDAIITLTRTQAGRSGQIQVPNVQIVENSDGTQVNRSVMGPIDFQEMLNDLELLQAEINKCVEEFTNPVIPEEKSVSFSPAVIIARLEQIDGERVNEREREQSTNGESVRAV